MCLLSSELMAAVGAGDPDHTDHDELPIPGTSLEGLAKAWEDDEVIRRFALHNEKGTVLTWPSPKHIGVATFETISKNGRIMEALLENWCPQVSAAKTTMYGLRTGCPNLVVMTPMYFALRVY